MKLNRKSQWKRDDENISPISPLSPSILNMCILYREIYMCCVLFPPDFSQCLYKKFGSLFLSCFRFTSDHIFFSFFSLILYNSKTHLIHSLRQMAYSRHFNCNDLLLSSAIWRSNRGDNMRQPLPSSGGVSRAMKWMQMLVPMSNRHWKWVRPKSIKVKRFLITLHHSKQTFLIQKQIEKERNQNSSWNRNL